jgi:E3 ubiquitin-protein ligase UBR3
MSLTSTMIIIYHRRYITLFQSPYLDKHFEEDRNLRRGKSLFLSEARYHKLEELWITHDFERKLAWHFIPIEELDNILRRCHMF